MSTGATRLPPPPAGAGPWTRLAGALLARRRRRGTASARRLPAPVLSVGNLQLGGSGKTPLVAAVAAHLRDRGLRVAILSRGYGRRGSGVLIVSRGAGPEAPASASGDEPWTLADDLPGVNVVVGEDRYQAGMAVAAETQVFVLDDGFSHFGLARDLDLLVFPRERPWGNGRLLPFGHLREPLSAAAEADAVVLTGVAAPLAGAAEPLAAALRPSGFGGPAFAAGLEARLAPEPCPQRVVLATGVARPERVLTTARGLGLEVTAHLAFRDHHRFPRASLERIERERRRTGAGAVVVTSKERGKVSGRLAPPVHEIRVRAVLEPAFWGWLDAALRL